MGHQKRAALDAAAHWAMETQGTRWVALIEQAMRTRHSGQWDTAI